MVEQPRRASGSNEERYAERDRSLLLNTSRTVERPLANERRVPEEGVAFDCKVLCVGDGHSPSERTRELVVPDRSTLGKLKLGTAGSKPDSRTDSDADPVRSWSVNRPACERQFESLT